MGIKEDKVARIAIERMELDARVWGALVSACRDRDCCPVQLLASAEEEGIEKARSIAVRLLDASPLTDGVDVVMDSLWRFLTAFRRQAGRLVSPTKNPTLHELRHAADAAALIIDPDSRTIPLNALSDTGLLVRLLHHIRQLYPHYLIRSDDLEAAILSERWLYEQYSNPVPDSVGPWGARAEGPPEVQP